MAPSVREMGSFLSFFLSGLVRIPHMYMFMSGRGGIIAGLDYGERPIFDNSDT